MLFIVSGASGAGKSTLCERLLSDFPTLTLSVSYTTRPPRGREADGVHYHFVDDATFEAMVSEGAFAEWARVHGNSYGTLRSEATERVAAGAVVLLDIDVQGAAQVRASGVDAAYLFIEPPSFEALATRLRGRATDAADVIDRRLAIARAEIAQAHLFDHRITNDDLDVAHRRFLDVIAIERLARR